MPDHALQPFCGAGAGVAAPETREMTPSTSKRRSELSWTHVSCQGYAYAQLQGCLMLGLQWARQAGLFRRLCGMQGWGRFRDAHGLMPSSALTLQSTPPG